MQAASASSNVEIFTPVSVSVSVSFGVIKSHKDIISLGNFTAGAGFNIVFTPADLAISKPFFAASIGCSS